MELPIINERRHAMKPTCPKLGNYFGFGSAIIRKYISTITNRCVHVYGTVSGWSLTTPAGQSRTSWKLCDNSTKSIYFHKHEAIPVIKIHSLYTLKLITPKNQTQYREDLHRTNLLPWRQPGRVNWVLGPGQQRCCSRWCRVQEQLTSIYKRGRTLGEFGTSS